MKHVTKVNRPIIGQIETTGFSIGQIVYLIAQILTTIANAILMKEGGTNTTTTTV